MKQKSGFYLCVCLFSGKRAQFIKDLDKRKE